MYEYLIQNPKIATIYLLAVLALAIYVFVKIVQTVGLEKVRKVVYKAFVEAEHEFIHGQNASKFEYVVEIAKNKLPMPYCMFISESLLRTTIQLWFDICKDLLDDGKFNKSSKE